MDKRDQEFAVKIMAVKKHHKNYGVDRIAQALKAGKKRVSRVAEKENLDITPRRKKKYRKKEDENQPEAGYPNLTKNLRPIRPNVVWAADFTYLQLLGGTMYLATVIDLFTREIVGYAIADKHDTSLIEDALLEAFKKTGSVPEIHHSDQGSEYKSLSYTGKLKFLGVKISMSKKAHPWENGFQESFYSGFKDDLGDLDKFENTGELVEAIHQTINYYNKSRIHSALKSSPQEFRINYENKIAPWKLQKYA